MALKRLMLSFIILVVCLSKTLAETVHIRLKADNLEESRSESSLKPLTLQIFQKISVKLPAASFLISGYLCTSSFSNSDSKEFFFKPKALKKLLVTKGIPARKVRIQCLDSNSLIANERKDKAFLESKITVISIYGISEVEAVALRDAVNKSNIFTVSKDGNGVINKYIENISEYQVEDKAARDLVNSTKKDWPVFIDVERSNLPDTKTKDYLKPVEKPEFVDVVNIYDFYKDQKKLSPSNLKQIRSTAKESAPIEKAKAIANIIRKTSTNTKIKNKIIRKIEKDKSSSYLIGYSLMDKELVAERPGFKATWVTDQNMNIFLGYRYKLNKKYILGAKINYNLQEFKGEENTLFDWNNTTPNLIKLSASLDYTIDKQWNLGFDLNYFEESFVVTRGLDISLEKAGLLGFSGRGERIILDNESIKTVTNLTVDFAVGGGSSVGFNTGYSATWSADLNFKRMLENYDLAIGAFLGVRRFSTVQNIQSETIAGIQLQFKDKSW